MRVKVSGSFGIVKSKFILVINLVKEQRCGKLEEALAPADFFTSNEYGDKADNYKKSLLKP